MIANMLMRCARRHDFWPTLLLANWQTTGQMSADVGEILHDDAAVDAAGTLSVFSGYSSGLIYPHGESDWLAEVFIDVMADGTVPSISINSGTLNFLMIYNGAVYMSSTGASWEFSSWIPGQFLTIGRHHFAAGRQAGRMQAWWDGSRVVDGPASGTATWGADPQFLIAGPAQIGPIRFVEADIYGNSANIAVPTLPLGIV